MTALEQLSSWGADPDIEVFISAQIVGGAEPTTRAWSADPAIEVFISGQFVGRPASAMRIRGAELLGKIGTVTINPANVLSINTVRGVRFVSIACNAGSRTYLIVIVPTSLFATDRHTN
jgi:hypothetical protein